MSIFFTNKPKFYIPAVNSNEYILKEGMILKSTKIFHKESYKIIETVNNNTN